MQRKFPVVVHNSMSCVASSLVLKETSRYLNELCCQIPLYQPKSLSAYNKYLGEIEKTASGRFWIEDWSWQ